MSSAPLPNHDQKSAANPSVSAKLTNLAGGKNRPMKWFVCELCGKRYISKAHMLRHVAHTHPNQMANKKPNAYFCEECSLSFVDESILRAHIRSHTGEKPFACEVCNKTFSQSGNRNTHQEKCLYMMIKKKARVLAKGVPTVTTDNTERFIPTKK